jgi:membrane protease YdiL (CAAX protease family)
LAEVQRQQAVELSGAVRRTEISVTIFGLVLPTCVTLIYFVGLASAPAKTQQLGYGLCKIFQFLFPLIWVCVILREPIRRPANSLGGLGTGIGFGLMVSLAMVALYSLWLRPSGLLESASVEVGNKVHGFGVNGVGKFIAMGAGYALVHAFLEEYYWRWFVFGRMRLWTSLTTAVIVSSLGFMAHHVLVLSVYFGWSNPLTYFFSLSVAVGGAVWAVLYHRSGNILAPWLSHLLVDASIFLIGYFMVGSQLA